MPGIEESCEELEQLMATQENKRGEFSETELARRAGGATLGEMRRGLEENCGEVYRAYNDWVGDGEAEGPARTSEREAAEPVPARSAEEELAIDACADMADRITAGDLMTHLNQFLEQESGRIPPSRLLTAMRAECGSTITDYEDAYRQAMNARHEESLEARENEAPWWTNIPEPLGSCFRDFTDADYLSGEAQRSAVCIVDEMAFGGSVPNDVAERNLTAEMLFHATWATWDSASRSTYCQPIKARGFDAAEELGIATVRTWNSQLAAAGVDRQFDDYAMVLDFLDVCEAY